MSKRGSDRVRELFLAALDVPAKDRGSWLVGQCGDDERLLSEIRSLLKHDSPKNDPLEKGLAEAIPDSATLTVGGTEAGAEVGDRSATTVGREHFLSKLLEVGVLSQDELDALSRTIASDDSDVRQLATDLVRQGKLTEYQATALLKGQPELLIDKYLILDLLDAGGMGVVFKAIHRPMNRLVAMKVISEHLLASAERIKRFRREVRVAATLEHPNIVRAYDADKSGRTHFLVMEYVRGENLARKICRQGPPSPDLAIDWTLQAAQALQYAHEHGVVHRDIKPSNLMLTADGCLKVLDLGLANVDESFRLAQQASGAADEAHLPLRTTGSDVTVDGSVLGTVSFMAPEQSLDAHRADARADIYSLGCTLYFLLVGEPPYSGDTIFQVFLQHRDAAVPGIRDKRPDVSESVESVYRRMTAKEPEDRFQSMAEVIHSLRSAMPLRLAVHQLSDQDESKAAQGRRASQTHEVLPPIRAAVKITPIEKAPVTAGRPRAMVYGAIAAGAFALLMILGILLTLAGRDADKQHADEKEVGVQPDAAFSERGEKRPLGAVAPFGNAQARKHQKEWAEFLGEPVERTFTLGDDATLTMVLIPPGEFLMGSSEEVCEELLHSMALASDELLAEWPQHRVKISSPFLLSKFEVTQAQWDAIMAANPSQAKSPSHPVEGVNWNDVQQYIERLNRKRDLKGVRFLLPTEAQWEYACRAGSTSLWHYGDDVATLGEYAWCQAAGHHPVGELSPNAWGLHDMHGNVWEWCSDWYSADYYHKSPATDPRGPIAGISRVDRGASFYDTAITSRSGRRHHRSPDERGANLGFRLAAVLTDTDARVSSAPSGNKRMHRPFSPHADSERAAAKWVVDAGGTVTIRTRGSEKTITAAPELPSGEFVVVGFRFRGDHDFAADGLRHIRGLRGIEFIQILAGNRLTDPDLENFGELKTLRFLDLQGNGLIGTGLEYLRDEWHVL